MNQNSVYLWYTDEPTPQFKDYYEVAVSALSAIEVDLPAQGTVLLKPNATVLYPPERRVIVHPGFLAGMIDTLVKQNITPERILVADGQSGENPAEGLTWEKCGYTRTLADAHVRLLEMNNVKSKTVPVPDGVIFSEYNMPAVVVDCSFFFNIPLAKCHNLGCTTLAIKNLMGIVTRPQRHLCTTQPVDEPFESELWRISQTGLSVFEDRFYHKLCDLLVAFRHLGIPRLCMIDGLVGRDGTGFNEGENRTLGWTLLGENEVLVDTVGTYLMGLNPLKTPYLRVAAERGLGTNRVEEIPVFNLHTGKQIFGQELQQFVPPEPLMPIAPNAGTHYPRFRADGSVVPWNLQAVNQQREADNLDLISV